MLHAYFNALCLMQSYNSITWVQSSLNLLISPWTIMYTALWSSYRVKEQFLFWSLDSWISLLCLLSSTLYGVYLRCLSTTAQRWPKTANFYWSKKIFCPLSTVQFLIFSLNRSLHSHGKLIFFETNLIFCPLPIVQFLIFSLHNSIFTSHHTMTYGSASFA